jgi:putative hemolysin
MLGTMLLRLSAIVALILANGFFVAAEFAIVSLRPARLEQLLATETPGARLVERLQGRLDDFLPAVQLGVTLCSLALGWVGEPTIAALLMPALAHLPHPQVYAHLVAAPLAFMVITYHHVLLGELVPKSLALRRGDHLALSVAGPMLFFMAACTPVVGLMNRSAAVILRLFRAPVSHEEPAVHSPDELKYIATSARETGILPPFQEALIHRAVEISETPTREIMTPRQRIFSLPADTPVPEASARFVEELHSRIPVYDPERGPEAITGVVYAKDVARLMHTAALHPSTASPVHTIPLSRLAREPLFVPETKPVIDLLQDLRASRRQIAIVVDEFGTTVGLVTVEDAIEQLVGELEDEFDELGAPRPLDSASGQETAPAQEPALPIVLDGSTALRDLETQMHWSLPREAGIETLAGFLLTELGHIPVEGESVVWEGRRLTVTSMHAHRIAEIRVEATEPDEAEDVESGQPSTSRA